MKRSLFVLGLLTFFAFGPTAYAMCTWGVVPVGRVYKPVDQTDAFLAYDDGIQTLVLQPEFTGDVDEFAIVVPVPGEPDITEGPTNIFAELNDLTNPLVDFGFMFDDVALDAMSVPEVAEEKVTVIEEKVVGDFDVAVLTARDAEALVDWLDDNDYAASDDDLETIDYYVDQDDFFFVALKINVDSDKLGVICIEFENGSGECLDEIIGTLDPVQIAFETDTPQLPMRSLASDLPEMTFNLYTLSATPVYVPGVDVLYADIIDAEAFDMTPSLEAYSPAGKWLLRHEVMFAPNAVTSDLLLEVDNGDDFDFINVNDPRRISPEDLDSATGILEGSAPLHGEDIISPVDPAMNPGIPSTSPIVPVLTRSLTIGSSGEDVRALQVFLNGQGFEVASIGAGSSGNESTYFGERTHQAVVRFQNFYRDGILTPVGLTTGSGYVGPSTIGFIEVTF